MKRTLDTHLYHLIAQAINTSNDYEYERLRKISIGHIVNTKEYSLKEAENKWASLMYILSKEDE